MTRHHLADIEVTVHEDEVTGYAEAMGFIRWREAKEVPALFLTILVQAGLDEAAAHQGLAPTEDLVLAGYSQWLRAPLRVGDALRITGVAGRSGQPDEGRLACDFRVYGERETPVGFVAASFAATGGRPPSSRAPRSAVSLAPPGETVAVRIEQGQNVSYASLSGDRRPIHVDRAWARRAGFDDCVMPGLGSLGVIMAGLQRALAPDGGVHLAEAGVQFARPVYPGNDLDVTLSDYLDRRPFRSWRFQATCEGTQVMRAGSVTMQLADR
jgi:acyl dehydratase